ncbi:hypothetical protein ACFWP7_20055 [Streptomyces sp. NPDC058470]|uniref:hypothetical protein n=1 Tax=Streptomyces sp. NPDC058470 TaxID=3346515 RepID=UPI0036506307
MHHFYGVGTGSRQLRLSISTLTPDRIGAGPDRPAAAVTAGLRTEPTAATAATTGAVS